MTFGPLGFLQTIELEPFMAMIHQAYFDESGKKGDHPVVTFSGVAVSQSKLQGFDDAWNELLRSYGLPSLHMARASRLSEKHGHKIRKGQSIGERIDALIPFADCINDHLEIGLLQALDVNGFNSLSKAAKIQLGSPDDPYHIAFARGLLEIVDYVPEDDRISLICDDDPETAWDCYRHYRGVRRVHAEIRRKTVSLSFADDEYFPGLQAVDMVAFLSRLEAKRQFYGDDYRFQRLFDHLITEKGVNHMQWSVMFADEKKLKELGTELEPPKKKG